MPTRTSSRYSLVFGSPSKDAEMHALTTNLNADDTLLEGKRRSRHVSLQPLCMDSPQITHSPLVTEINEISVHTRRCIDPFRQFPLTSPGGSVR